MADRTIRASVMVDLHPNVRAAGLNLFGSLDKDIVLTPELQLEVESRHSKGLRLFLREYDEVEAKLPPEPEVRSTAKPKGKPTIEG